MTGARLASNAMYVLGNQPYKANTTINNHLASLSSFASWIQVHNPHLFPKGNPVKGIGELALVPLEPRALSEDQVKSLKNLCDRLNTFHRLKGRRWANNGQPAPLRILANSYPLRY